MTDVIQVVADGDRGGGTTYVIGLAEELLRRGYEVTVITTKGSFLHGHAQLIGANSVGLPFSARRNTPALSILLRNHFIRLKPQVIHAHGSRAGLPTAFASPWRNWKFIYSVHGFHHISKCQPARLLGGLAERVCLRAADEVIFVAADDQEVAQRSGLIGPPKRSYHIPNAAEVDFECEPIENRTFDIGLIGRMVSQKNPLLLCDVLLAMRPARPVVVVVGDGPLRDRFRSHAHELGVLDQITLVGELPRSEALRTLAQCRTLILPSLHEGQPLTVIEAAHLGVPVVAAFLGGTQEIVDEGETGFLVPPADVAGYADRLGRILGDPDCLVQMSKAARSKARKEFCFQRVAEANLSIYKLLAIDGSTPPPAVKY